MKDGTVIDPQKLQTADLSQCGEQQLLELAKKLCGVAVSECGENGYRGGFRPGNIYVAEDGRVKVGKAARSGENGWTKIELEFMSPEMFWNGEESAAADVYSISLIMYAGLNGGRLPFIPEGDEANEKRAYALRRRMGGDRFEAPESAPEALAAIVEKGLAFEPKDRYADAGELLAALHEYCGDEPEAPEVIPEPEPEPIPEPEPMPEPEPEPAPEPEPEPVPEPEKVEEKPAPKIPAPMPVKGKKSKKKNKQKPKAEPAPEAEPVPKAEPVPEPAPEPKAEPTPPPKAEKKPAPKKSEGKKQKNHCGIIALAAVLVVVAVVLLVRGLGNGADDPALESPPVTSPPEQTTSPETQYMLYSEDVSWYEAEQSCIDLGGHLATIKDADDFERICSLLADHSAQYVWIGAYRDEDGKIKWLDGDEHDSFIWASGEPSVTDSYDGAAEDYIMLVKQSDGTWLFNDSRSDPLEQYSSFYSGKIAYICQIG